MMYWFICPFIFFWREGRQPEASGAITRTMIIGDALAETTGLYSLVIALLLMFANPFISQL